MAVNVTLSPAEGDVSEASITTVVGTKAAAAITVIGTAVEVLVAYTLDPL